MDSNGDPNMSEVLVLTSINAKTTCPEPAERSSAIMSISPYPFLKFLSKILKPNFLMYAQALSSPSLAVGFTIFNFRQAWVISCNKVLPA